MGDSFRVFKVFDPAPPFNPIKKTSVHCHLGKDPRSFRLARSFLNHFKLGDWSIQNIEQAQHNLLGVVGPPRLKLFESFTKNFEESAHVEGSCVVVTVGPKVPDKCVVLARYFTSSRVRVSKNCVCQGWYLEETLKCAVKETSVPKVQDTFH
jgi:hypothetical protein